MQELTATRQSEAWKTSASTTLRTLLTEFALPRTEPLPHAAVVKALAMVDVEPAASRQALSRAAKAGALERPPSVRRGEVLLTAGGRSLLQKMSADADLRADAAWDGTWTMVLVRGRIDRDPGNATRNRLLLETFGSLGNGMWIAPHGPRAETAVAVLSQDDQLGIVAGSLQIEHPPISDLVATTWDLDSVRRVYDEFLATASAMQPRTPEEVLAAWILLRRDWYAVIHADPEIPAAGLPADWPAPAAREVMQRRAQEWQPLAMEAFDSLL